MINSKIGPLALKNPKRLFTIKVILLYNQLTIKYAHIYVVASNIYFGVEYIFSRCISF